MFKRALNDVRILLEYNQNDEGQRQPHWQAPTVWDHTATAWRPTHQEKRGPSD